MADISSVNLNGVHTSTAHARPNGSDTGISRPNQTEADKSGGGQNLPISTSGFPPAPLREPDASTLAGPSPAFQASLLELQSDLQIVIKRIAAARELARSADAISPGSDKSETPDTGADTKPHQSARQFEPTSTNDVLRRKIGMTE